MWTDLESVHGRSAHGGLFTGWDMVAPGGVLGAAVQKGPGAPLTDLPVTVRRPPLPELNPRPSSREGVGPLRAREEASQALGSTEGWSPPKRENSSG